MQNHADSKGKDDITLLLFFIMPKGSTTITLWAMAWIIIFHRGFGDSPEIRSI